MTPDGIKRLRLDEGERFFVYDDATGEPVRTLPSGGWPTIGVGRNLSARGITQDESNYLLNNDITSFTAAIQTAALWTVNTNPVWFDVILMVEFNTGNVFAFKNMLAAMARGDGKTAQMELLNSRAAKEGPARYERMADAIEAKAWAF